MSSNYWRGLPVDRLPQQIWHAEYTQLRAAMDQERERIQQHKAALKQTIDPADPKEEERKRKGRQKSARNKRNKYKLP